MEETSLRTPTGEQFESPSQSHVDTLLSMPQEVWEGGSGDAAFYRRSASGSAMLSLFQSFPDGYHLQYFPEANRHDYFLSIGSGDLSRCVTIHVSGQAHALPIGVFVDRETALTAIREFLTTGERSGALQWKNRRELDWEDGTD